VMLAVGAARRRHIEGGGQDRQEGTAMFKVFPDKKDATLADIKVGDKVKVSYTDESGVLTAHRIGPPDVPKKTE